jgi:hypothetical protein
VQKTSNLTLLQETPLKAIVIAVDNYDIVSELGDALVAFL